MRVGFVNALLAFAAVVFSMGTSAAVAEQALIAVAANFVPAAVLLKNGFESVSKHRISIASGSTGKLYAQIVNGAPFDVLLAADELRPILLEQSGHGVAGSRFTYATGRLAVWMPIPRTGQRVDLNADTIADELGRSRRIAIANPELAPFGAAAHEVLDQLGLKDRLKGRLAMGENVAQAYAMVDGGAADAGLVAWSHILVRHQQSTAWLIPQAWHARLRQDALLLQHGAANSAALAFLHYLKSEPVRARISQLGYPADS